MPTINEHIFKKLTQILPDIETRQEAAKLTASGFMDFNIDILWRDGNTARVALSHYYKHPSGDLIADPDMEVDVDFVSRTAVARTFQDSVLFQNAEGNLELTGELNRFLNQWLSNVIDQGHKLVSPKPDYERWAASQSLEWGVHGKSVNGKAGR